MKKIFLILFILFIFFAAELLCRFLIPDKDLGVLESVMAITEEDPVLFWKQCPDLNTTFQAAKLKTNSLGLRNKELKSSKGGGVERIICLGDSFTFGWGVDAHSAYPFVLEQALNNSGHEDRKFEVVNAGEIGFSSYQGVRLLKNRLLAYSPDVLIIAYGFNDIDRYRFYINNGREDKDLRPASGFLLHGGNLIRRSRLFVLFRRALFWLIDHNDRLSSLSLKKQVELAKLRVTPGDYESNLKKMIEIGTADKSKIILMRVPLNLPLPLLSAYEEGILKDHSSLSTFYYLSGCEHEKKKQYALARDSFKKAKDYLAFECVRDNRRYQEIMSQVAGDYRLPIVDVGRLFQESREGEGLFNGAKDPIHASARGHRIIAEELYDIIAGGDF
ncbi:MAG: hypothetical protein JW788_05930 [Candidatus Omnitrophica bacterium]|nr:hypothetical protein [Candidatus Omnitrophota bacterium]